MNIFIRAFYLGLLRFLLSLRYRISIRGLEKIEKETGGILFLANHPAEVDPAILSSILFKYRPHPVAIDYLFHNKLINHFLKQVGALPVPHFEHGTNSYKKREMEKTYEAMFQLLRKNENVLLYPSGGLKKQAEEIIGGASGVHTILQNCPNAKVVLIRTLGLWGSSFSRAQTGLSPNLIKTGKERLKDLLKNGLIFGPRREIRIVVEMAPSEFPRQGSRLEINRYLETWYNQEGPEPLSLIPYVFWQKKSPKAFEEVSSRERLELSQVPSVTSQTVKEELARLCRKDPTDIHNEQFLARDLGLDSLDLAQIVLFLKETFGVANIHAVDLVKVEDVIAFAAGMKKSSIENGVEEKKSENRWITKKERPSTTPPIGKTIQEAFLRSEDRMGSHIACVDSFFGQTSYRRLKLSVLMLAEMMKKIPEDKIGIMLPATTTVNVLILAALMAKKIPVMINWTLGKRNLEAIVADVDLKVVISSYGFLDRLENIDLNGIDDKILLIDQMVQKLTLKQKLKILFRLPKKTSSLLKLYDLNDLSEDDPAVILFTSGTESVPKSVPLSHKNLLSNQRGGYEKVDITKSDVLLGVLPPFHSFGFSVTGLFPLLSGMRVVYFPNPIDGKKMASLIEQWQVTMICIVPTFLKNILRVAYPDQLKSLRLVVTGAEKTSRDLYTKLEVLNSKAKLSEGYGITECGPILTLNPLDQPPQGVGVPLEGVEIAIVDLTTHQRVPIGKEGLVVVRGPNIFKGYFNPKLPSPFIEIDNLFWYNTGDLGYIDQRGYLTLSGRLKRFVKVGGEMVSLGAIEESLLSSLLKKNIKIDPDVPNFAIVAKEEEGKKGEVHLMTTLSLSLEEVNNVLKESGMSNLIRISKIHTVPFIPLLGAGKIDYKKLASRL